MLPLALKYIIHSLTDSCAYMTVHVIKPTYSLLRLAVSQNKYYSQGCRNQQNRMLLCALKFIHPFTY